MRRAAQLVLVFLVSALVTLGIMGANIGIVPQRPRPTLEAPTDTSNPHARYPTARQNNTRRTARAAPDAASRPRTPGPRSAGVRAANLPAPGSKPPAAPATPPAAPPPPQSPPPAAGPDKPAAGPPASAPAAVQETVAVVTPPNEPSITPSQGTLVGVDCQRRTYVLRGANGDEEYFTTPTVTIYVRGAPSHRLPDFCGLQNYLGHAVTAWSVSGGDRRIAKEVSVAP